MIHVKTIMERWFLGLAILVAVSAATALSCLAAEKIPQELENVGISEHLGAHVDLNLKFRDEKGELVPLRTAFDGHKPVILLLAYYGCPNLCNMFLNGATDAFKELAWTAGNEYRVVTVSFDPTETPELAKGKKAAHLKALGRPEAAAGWSFWVNDVERPAPKNGVIEETNARKLANQVGFNYRYDTEQEQYAHAAAMMILTPEGRISRYLYGISFQPKDLRLALVEASDKKIGTVMDKILLFCYNYDPKTKKYAFYATNMMRAGGGLTVVLLGGFFVTAWRRKRQPTNV